eukprot:14893340-Ditylum_brightwellii.AAC.1
MQKPASYTVAKTLLKGDTLMVFEQAEIDCSNKTMPHFDLCLDGMTENVILKKAGQTQKRYMRSNLQLVGGMIVKD